MICVITTTDIPQQEVITKDNVPVGINAVVYFQVQNAEQAILNIKDYTLAVSQYAQAVLRDVIGGIELDSLLSEREKNAEEIQKIVAQATKSWGLLVTDIKIQDIELLADMKRIMAKQAESERERRAVIIMTEGEYAAAERLAQAAGVLSNTPGGLSMRTLQTIEKINPDPSKTVIFALPIEFFEGVKTLSQFLKDKTKWMRNQGMFQVEDIFSLERRGIIITGKLTDGFLRKGMGTIIGGKQVEVLAIESHHKLLESLTIGTPAGLLLSNNIEKKDIQKSNSYSFG